MAIMTRASRGLDRLDSEYWSQLFGQGRPRVSAALSSLSPGEAEPLVGLRRSLARTRDYSVIRSAFAGLTCVARRAGMYAAANAATSRISVTDANVTGSDGRTL
jgi:hypothetical protein